MDGRVVVGGVCFCAVAWPCVRVVRPCILCLSVQVTNAVTLKVLNTARNAAFVLFTVTFVGEEASWLQLMGYTISLLAFSVYSYVKFHNL